jgi:hypothetical protein
MSTKTAWYFLIVVCLFCVPAYAQNPNLGTSGAQFLQIPVGAHETAMGGAAVANVNGAAALFWNPAGIVGVTTNDLFFAHTPYWATITLNHAALVHTFEDIGSLGLSVTMLTMDPMEVTTELEPNGTGETFDAQDVMIGVSFARHLTEEFSVGVSAKYVRQRIWNESASGVAFDIGTQFRMGFRDLTVGMCLTNFGSDMRYAGSDLAVKYDASSSLASNRLSPADLTTSDYPLPLNFQVGVSMTVLEMDMLSALVAADFNHPNDNDERVNVGVDLKVAEYFSLRGGYRFGYDQESATMGAGVVLPLGDLKVVFDYAYALQKYLPDLQRITVGCVF